MKPQWESLVLQLNNAYKSWQEVYSALPSSFIFQDITIPTAELNAQFAETKGMINLVAESENINPVTFAVHQQNIVSLVAQIVQAVANVSGSPQPYLEQLINQLWSIKSSIVWFMPIGSNEYFERYIQNTNIIAMIESNQSLINQLIGLSESGNSSIIKIRDSELNAQELVTNLSEKLVQSEVGLQEILNKISGYEREALNAKINVDASASSALSNKESIETLLSRLSNGLTQQQEAQERINSLLDEAKLVLEGNSKAGLAASFGSRRKSLERSRQSWTLIFAFGIALLLGAAFVMTTDYLDLPRVSDEGKINAWAVIIRFSMMGPFVWLIWFGVRNYNVTTRLIEDYAFKEASALAFVGYKREMGDDAEMLKLLRESAIKNFGSSPTRMLSKSEPSSPLHELVDKALENQGIFDKLLQLFKALKPDKS